MTNASGIKGMETSILNGASDDSGSEDETKKVDVAWFDSFIDRKNIALDDQRKDMPKYRQAEDEFRES